MAAPENKVGTQINTLSYIYIYIVKMGAGRYRNIVQPANK